MSILVDDVVRDTAQRTGAQTVNVSVGDNDGTHSVQLQVCNEKGSCSPSATKSVQAYGPFATNHIISAQEHVREVDVNTYEVYWTITVDSNGDPGRVDVTSRSGDSDAIRDESYNLTDVDVETIRTRTVRLDAFKSDIILVHLYDTDPGPRRGAEGVPATRRRAQAARRVGDARGARAATTRAVPARDCNVDGTGIDCWGSECARIRLSTVNFTDDRIRCAFYDAGGQFGPFRWVDSNTTARARAPTTATRARDLRHLQRRDLTTSYRGHDHTLLKTEIEGTHP